jgi:hypothetical protein
MIQLIPVILLSLSIFVALYVFWLQIRMVIKCEVQEDFVIIYNESRFDVPIEVKLQGAFQYRDCCPLNWKTIKYLNRHDQPQETVTYIKSKESAKYHLPYFKHMTEYNKFIITILVGDEIAYINCP